MIEFKLPELGENISSGNVINVLVNEGDSVKKDQDLLELETEKASLPVPSPVDGTIQKIHVKAGDEAKVGAVIFTIDDGGKQEKSSPESGKKTEAKASDKKSASPKKESAPEKKEESPKQTSSEKKPASKAPAAAVSSSPLKKNVPAAPSVRRFAREIGIELTDVSGTGPGGRISKDDVKAHAKKMNQSRSAAPSGGPSIRPLPDFSKWGEIETKPMSQIRKVTAKHLSHCWQTIPHVTQFGKADITELENLRKRYSTPERKLTITPFLLKVMASALKIFPQFNASLDPEKEELIFKKSIHLGVAVDTDNGLLVPVLRDADQKSIFQINDELTETAKRARERKIGLDELRGGGMTLTNLGGIFGAYFTPIVNWPEVAILGVSRGEREPVFNGKEFEPRLRLPLSLSYDHRVIDGADGARFLKWVCEAIENPFLMELQ